ncbi:MAG: NAD(P)H-dependent oxidoreductase [Cellulophaga sp.]
MKTLLRIDCSPRVEGSHSRALANYFEKQWKLANPEGCVVYRDLIKHQPPHIQNDTIEGFYTPTDEISPEILRATALSDELIAELKSVNDILISSPLYNLNVPSNLKAYIDQVTRIGHTFNYNDTGYYGLLEDKAAYIITVKGGIYKNTAMESYDFQEPYLNAILGHMGISVKEIFSLEGTSDKEIRQINEKAARKAINSVFNN